ncbi:hypothetical protein PDJAM_G00080270 [Pangasius djambal]|uniref:Uncharacterized protein n=1 Tax=Pangasius djambal TaxID=1691987 RepID=A0ACC5Z307_9TELE|nr:hypothetical protein [Pangasius djambal]
MARFGIEPFPRQTEGSLEDSACCRAEATFSYTIYKAVFSFFEAALGTSRWWKQDKNKILTRSPILCSARAAAPADRQSCFLLQN